MLLNCIFIQYVLLFTLTGLLHISSCTGNSTNTASTPVTLNTKAVQNPKTTVDTILVTQKTSDSASDNPVYGKYACTASRYRNGEYEFIPRGSFTITDNGQYTYYGFERAVSGSYKVDKDGNLMFTDGYFDKGKAEKTDRPNKFFLVFPTIPDNRWTCTLIPD